MWETPMGLLLNKICPRRNDLDPNLQIKYSNKPPARKISCCRSSIKGLYDEI